jgi:uncharacterized protein YdaU (DUF1376 family)
MTDTAERSPPLTPPDLDLRKSHPWMPVDVQAWLRSTFTIRSTGDEYKAGSLLWFESWHQVPAGSLPNDDTDLAYLAGLGRDVEKWLTVKPMAMRNMVLATDGRWYHKTVSEKARDVHEEQQRKSEHGKKGAKKRWKGEEEQPDMLDGCPGIADPLLGQCPSNAPAVPGQCDTNANRVEQSKTEQTKSEQNKSVGAGLPRSVRQGGRECVIPERWELSRAEVRVGLECGLSDKETRFQAKKFHNYWLGRSGQIGVKKDWMATWRNWVLTEAEKLGRSPKVIPEDAGDGGPVGTTVLPKHGQRVTEAMVNRHVPVVAQHLGRVFVLGDSDEYHAWVSYLTDQALQANKRPPTITPFFNKGWSFPERWPPDHVQRQQ